MEKKKKEVIKKEKEKVRKVQFDKIDISNVTDDEIIKSGIRYNTKGDYICYFIMFVIFILAIIPPIIRAVNPKPITEMEANIIYINLTCYKTSYRDNYELSTTLSSIYRDGDVQTVKIDFSSRDQKENGSSGFVPAEIDEIEKLNLDGIKKTTNGNTTSFEIDFYNNPEYVENDVLSDYSHVSGVEIEVLSKKGFKCRTESETKLEVVDVKTRRKVE